MSWALRLVVVALLMVPAGFGAALAQQTPDPNCADDRGVDRCAAEQGRRVLDLFGLRPIEAHRDSGDQVRRVFYVDGYGRDLVAIAFVRAAGREPMLWVHFPRRRNEERHEPMSAPVPAQVWQDILFRSQLFDRELASPATANGEPALSICLHSWVYTVEASDPPSPADSSPATIRREVEDSCEHGLGQVFAIEAQRAALPLLPACASLDPDQHRGPASMIAACGRLSGDRMAAAAVMNQAYALQRAHRPEHLDRIQGLFDYRGTVDWHGERRGGGGNAAALHWLAKLGERDQTNFHIERVEGQTPYRVRLIGTLGRPVAGNTDGNGGHEQAPVEQTWALGPARVFQIESTTVGPFAPLVID